MFNVVLKTSKVLTTLTLPDVCLGMVRLPESHSGRLVGSRFY